MDPFTSFAEMTKALAEMVTAIVSGMPPADKQKVWDWFIADQERLRKWFKIDG